METGDRGEQSSRTSFWATLPGVLTGVAALITALVTAAAFLFGGHDAKDASPSGTAKALAETTTGTPVEAPTGSATPTPRAATEDWQVTLQSGEWLDLDTGMVSTGGGGDIVWGSGQLNLYGTRNAATTGEPGKAGCLDVLEQRSDGFLQRHQLQAGAVVCVSTPEGVVAEIQVSPPDVNDRLPLDVTAWR